MRSGDQAAFRELVATYQSKVYNTAMGMVQDVGAAEDITQEVFITVYKSILSFNEHSSLSTWIYRITVNKCLDYLRARQRRKNNGFFSLLFDKDNGEALHEKPVFDHPGILLEHKENARYLFEAIEMLPGSQKAVFVLAYIEELPQKEISEIMGLGLKAVESLIQRAKVNLRKKLGHIYDRGAGNEGKAP